jgi:cytochrome oxidase Cu insertion factor (SCO1/SenC/PrrC family)
VRPALAALLLVLPLGAASAHELPRATPALEFEPPAAGSYQLPPIQKAPSGKVIDSKGRAHDLSRFVTGKATLLSLFYAQCADPDGCPLAFSTMVDLRDRLRVDPAVARRVRLVSLSFDPAHDTPARLAEFGRHFAGKGVQWDFLTTASMRDALPLLDALGQDVAVEQDGRDGSPRVISHLLKLFLIDPAGRVREIYSTAFLQTEVVYNDIMTLLLDDAAPVH